jgi:CubicO group peptidase (beta-lactamase class C family)
MQKLIDNFVKRINAEKLRVEGIAIYSVDEKLAEYRWIPDLARNIYSHTKSFTATAVGIALDERRLSLEDKLIDYFPDKVTDDPSYLLKKIKLKHLLTMSSGFNKPLLMGAMRRAGTGMPDYIKYMLSQKVQVTPGTKFCYSTADSILAARMVEKRVGKKLTQYLYEKLFEPLNIGYPRWEHCPMGHPCGGGGMCLTLDDMAKLGQLYLNEGVWNGKKIVSLDWIKQATSKQIDTPVQDDNDWLCGYGYQFWLSPYSNAYRADGAHGQVTTVLPAAQLVVSIQCPEDFDNNMENQNFSKVRKVLHEEIFSLL